jgi:hypothetical protein
LASETAWPPTVLFVTVMTTNATLVLRRRERAIERVEVHVAAEGGVRD